MALALWGWNWNWALFPVSPACRPNNCRRSQAFGSSLGWLQTTPAPAQAPVVWGSYFAWFLKQGIGFSGLSSHSTSHAAAVSESACRHPSNMKHHKHVQFSPDRLVHPRFFNFKYGSLLCQTLLSHDHLKCFIKSKNPSLYIQYIFLIHWGEVRTSNCQCQNSKLRDSQNPS